MPNPMMRRLNWSITTSTQCVRRLSDSQRNRSMLHKLFECIRAEMKKGSPEGYNTETAFPEAAQKLQTGEPNDRYTLYRIRCSQEKRQLLRERWRRNEGKLRATRGALRQMGWKAHGAVAR